MYHHTAYVCESVADSLAVLPMRSSWEHMCRIDVWFKAVPPLGAEALSGGASLTETTLGTLTLII